MKRSGGALLLLAMIMMCSPSRYPEGLYAVIKTPKGTIVANLEYEKAPLMVANFVGLAEGTLHSLLGDHVRFYDGLKFHHVDSNSIIIGGDPKADGTGGPGYQIPGALNPELKHDSPGILSMASAGTGTIGSQFCITLASAPQLDNLFPVFGHVIEGMGVARKIAPGDRMESVKIVRSGAKALAFKVDQAALDALVKQILARNEQEKEKKAGELKDRILRQFPDAVAMPGGIMYVQQKKGSGNKPSKGDHVKVHCAGPILETSSKFDTSRNRLEPFEFDVGVGQWIPGLDRAILDMTKGERRTVVMPASLAWGDQGVPERIPVDAVVVFDVELADIIAGR